MKQNGDKKQNGGNGKDRRFGLRRVLPCGAGKAATTEQESDDRKDGRFRLRGAVTWGAGIVVYALALAALLERGITFQVEPGKPETFRYPEAPALAAEQLIPTSTWMNFYGMESFVDGKPLPVGSLIQAYDPQGVLCGEFTVKREGSYGLMPVYGDDPATPWDEGAMPQDLIALRVNGIEAVSTPAMVLWTAHGDLQWVELTVFSQPLTPSGETGFPLR